jgi:hypothetical protein
MVIRLWAGQPVQICSIPVRIKRLYITHIQAAKNRNSSLYTPWTHMSGRELQLHLFWTSAPDGGECISRVLLARLKMSGALPPLPIRMHDVHTDKFTFVFNRLVSQTSRQTERKLENPGTYFAVRPFMVLSTLCTAAQFSDLRCRSLLQEVSQLRVPLK